MKNLLVVAGLLTIFAQNLFGQQDPEYSMYMFNGLILNPAYAGSREQYSFTALYRHQWAGIEGAPKTATISGHSPLANDRVGLGFSLVNDIIGVSNRINFTGNYAYRIPMNYGKLSLGLLTSLSHYSAKYTQLVITDANDPAYAVDAKSLWMPNFGFGIYYYSDRMYIGASVPHLLNNSLDHSFRLEGQNRTAREYKHYFFTAGYVLGLTGTVELKPSVLFKYQPNSPFEADINFSALFNDAFWIGASYRTGDAVVLMMEYDIKNQFRIGYSYDYTISELSNYNTGTHEIMVGYEFKRKTETYLTPRRMTYF